jgi:anaerobic selenocysteine-containing dehydrogenase
MSQKTNKLSRRGLFAGAGAVGAVATVGALLPSVQSGTSAATKALPTPPSKGGGYFLSEHVQRYYKTTRV